ncbi:hypothetical protein BX616_008633 [Lobosporangium transversale]|nr:hypothetical protein BX616_008633 [Lobosporangium transversale]
MSDPGSVLMPPSAVPSEDQAMISRKRKFAAIAALTKRLAASVENNTNAYDAVLGKLEEAIVEAKDNACIRDLVKGMHKSSPEAA